MAGMLLSSSRSMYAAAYQLVASPCFRGVPFDIADRHAARANPGVPRHRAVAAAPARDGRQLEIGGVISVMTLMSLVRLRVSPPSAAASPPPRADGS